MKHANKIVALLLCFTLLVSAMAIFVSAQETDPATEPTPQASVEPNYTTEWLTTSDALKTTGTNAVISPVQSEDKTLVEPSAFKSGEYAIYTYGDNQFISMDKIAESGSAYANIYTGIDGRTTHKPADGWYTIVQFDSAYFGTLSGTINPLFRDGAGPHAFSISNTTLFKDVAPGEVAQFTFIFYSTTVDGVTKGYVDVYRDGKTVATAQGGATIQATGYADVLRVYFEQCFMVFDNVYVNYAATNPVENGVLADEYNQFNKAEYKKLVLPPVATVDGVEYNNVTAMSNAITCNSEVEFLAPPMTSDDKLVVKYTSTINTNGFVTVDDLDLPLNSSNTVDGNVIKVLVPNYTSSVLTESDSTAATTAGNAVRSPITGSGATSVAFANKGAGEYILYDTGDNSFITINKISTAADSYAQLLPKSSSSHLIKDYPYLIVQYDAAYLGATPTGSMRPTCQLPGTTAPAIQNSVLFENMDPGEVAQFTFVFYATQSADNPDEGTAGCYVYRNGVYRTNDSGWAITNWSTAYHNQLRGYQSTSNPCPIAIDNLYAMYFTADPRLEGTDGKFDFGQYEDGNFVSYNQFNDSDYTQLVMPAIATVDGVEYSTITELNAALVARDTTAEVEFLHNYTAGPAGIANQKVVVKCNAVINTNGFITADNLDLSNARYTVDGNVITTVASNYAIDYVVTNDKLAELKSNGAYFASPHSSDPKGTYAIVTSENGKFLYVDKTVLNWRDYAGVGIGSKATADTYKVLQFDMALTGTSESDGQDYYAHFMIGGGLIVTPFSTALKGSKKGEFGRVTAVFYLTEAGALTVEYYYNGVYTGGGTNAGAASETSIRVIASSANTQLYLSNVTVHTTTEHPAVDKVLKDEYNTTAIQFPTIATIDGVEYNSVDAINAELAKPRNTPAEIVFLHDYTATPWYTGKITVGCSAIINTNGFITADALDLANVAVSANGNTIATTAPNYVSSTSGFTAAVKSDFENNEFSSTLSANGNWETITTADGSQFVNIHHAQNLVNMANGVANTGIRWDLVTSAANKHITVTPAYTVQFELIRTGNIVGKAVSVLGKIDNSSVSYPLNKELFNTRIMNDYLIGETVQFTVNFGAVQNEDGSGTVYVYLYVNGVYQSDNLITMKLTADEYAGFYWYALRLPFSETDNKSYATVALDNMYIRGFNTNVLGENGLLPDEYNQFARADHNKLALPEVALVDGVAVGYEDIDAILADGGNHEVELLHKPWRTLTVQSNATIKTNGYTGIVAGDGYLATEADGVITVEKDERTTTIKLTVDGVLVATIEDALYTTNHETLVRALDNFLHNGNVYVKDGKYYELVWDFAKQDYASEITYNATAAEHKILVVNTDTNEVVSGQLAYTEGVLTDGIMPTFPAIFYFNADVESTALMTADNTNTTHRVEWNLNGHCYNYNNTTHAFYFDANDEVVFKNGTINVNATNAFLASASGNPQVTLDNVTLNCPANITDWRAGTINFIDCDITTTTGKFAIGARVSGDMYINITNCEIRKSGAQELFYYYNNKENFSYDDGALTNYARHITVKDSTIKTLGTLVAMTNDAAIKLGEGEINDVLLSVENSTVYASTVYSGADFAGTVKFGEGVKYAINDRLDVLTADDGVMLGVKTNDIGFDFIATANYATVNWAEGVTEYWADGTTPVASASDYKNYVVTPVVAGEIYTFEAGTANDYQLKANLLLTNTLFYNIYEVPADAKVTVNGEPLVYDAENERYSYELLARYALGDIYIVIEFNDGTVYSKATNLMAYIEGTAKKHAGDEKLINLFANMLAYVLEVQNYEYAPLAQAEAKAFIAAHAPSAAETTKTVDVGNLANYFESGFFYLDGEINLVLTAKEGVDLGKVAVKVGDYTAEVSSEDGILVLTLPAYVLTDAIELTVAEGVTVYYALGNYVVAVSGTNAEAVATALYNYAHAAKAYEDARNAQ